MRSDERTVVGCWTILCVGAQATLGVLHYTAVIDWSWPIVLIPTWVWLVSMGIVSIGVFVEID